MTLSQRLISALGAAALLFTIAVAFASISVFDYEESLWSISRDIFYRIFAPLYPGRSDRWATVVLLDDASFRDFDVYPVKYGTHARILEALATYHPRAVFVDFAFVDNRPDATIEDLKRVIDLYHSRNIPLYIPTYKNGNIKNITGIRPDLAKLAGAGKFTLVSFELGRPLWGTPVYPLYSYQEGYATVGAQIAKDLEPQMYAEKISKRTEFEIWWGLPPAPTNCRRDDHECGFWYSFWGRLISNINPKFRPLGWELSDEEIVRYPYSPFVTAGELLDGNKRSAIEGILKNKVIMYGPDLDIARDNFPNPVFSFRSKARYLPGVFFHAMALENIFDLKGNIKEPRSQNLKAMWVKDIISIGFVCLVFSIGRFIETYFNDRLKRFSWIFDMAAIMISAVMIAVVEFLYFNLGPSNWMGVFSFVTLARIAEADRRFRHFGWLTGVSRTARTEGTQP